MNQKAVVKKLDQPEDLVAAGKILAKIKDKLDEDDFKIINGVINRNVIALGTDEAFALRDNKGDIRAFKQRVYLSVADGTLNKLPAGNGKFVYPISAQGFEKLAEATGTCVIFPDTVTVNGKTESNPYVERDQVNNRNLSVSARAIAFRFSSKGIPQVADWSTTFSPGLYRMIDLLAKAKKTPQAFRLLPNDMNADSLVSDDAPNATWAKYVFDESSNLWVNTSHEEALQWYSQIINREKKSIDFAQTFARRNAVKHLIALQKAPTPEWSVTVLCWRPTSGNIVKWDATQYKQLQDEVGGIIHGTNKFSRDLPKIEMQHGTERVEDEQGLNEMLEQTDPEDQETVEVTPGTSEPEPDADIEPEEPQHEMSKEDAAILKNEATAKNSFPDEYLQACKNIDQDPDASHTPVVASLILKEINNILDEQMG